MADEKVRWLKKMADEKVIALPLACAAWGRADFAAVLKAELEALPHAALPLQAGLAHSSVVADEPFTVLVGGVDPAERRMRATVLYAGIVAGCNCADDPTPVESQPERCELELGFELAEGRARCRLVE